MPPRSETTVPHSDRLVLAFRRQIVTRGRTRHREPRTVTVVETAARARVWLFDPSGRRVVRFADMLARTVASRRREAIDYSVSVTEGLKDETLVVQDVRSA